MHILFISFLCIYVYKVYILDLPRSYFSETNTNTIMLTFIIKKKIWKKIFYLIRLAIFFRILSQNYDLWEHWFVAKMMEVKYDRNMCDFYYDWIVYRYIILNCICDAVILVDIHIKWKDKKVYNYVTQCALYLFFPVGFFFLLFISSIFFFFCAKWDVTSFHFNYSCRLMNHITSKIY